MQKTRALGRGGVDAQLACHDAAEGRDLDAVLEDVLAEGCAVTQGTQHLDDLGVKVMDARVERGLLARLPHALVHERLRLFVHLLDARGVDAAVGYEVLERDAGGLSTHGVEAGEDDRLGGVIDDEGDA